MSRWALAAGLGLLRIVVADHHIEEPELVDPFSDAEDGAGIERTAYMQMDFETARDWTMHVLDNAGSRRRWGHFDQESELCFPTDNGTMILDLCRDNVAPNMSTSDFLSHDLPHGTWEASSECTGDASTPATCCHSCMACETFQCYESISGCQGFINAIYVYCDMEAFAEPSPNPGYVLLMCCGCVFVVIIVIAGYKWSNRFSVSSRLEQMATSRKEFIPDGGSLPLWLVLSGSWVDAKGVVEEHIEYELMMTNLGGFAGKIMDSEVSVKGKVNITAGRIGWVESGRGVFAEVDGIIRKTGKGLSIEANSLNSKGKAGKLVLSGVGMASSPTSPSDGLAHMTYDDADMEEPPPPPSRAFESTPIGNP
eukprot:CAMPEP_0197625694 /NCGR_PEP_ID=MMETSP1338-20131121/4979_1 /TAXON_ID=43686 ORGANISM="Pelagodinium beii, Strain RCC1491" /NCGR_SAMPLE_ID=MMETSP1338 /ASSEMBLY_ACC=CAM_ASM_000754 /LENGTH=366 /DNA_ID=CAMNT_0043196153 /DNA_START=42 /DNA_END=1138 /DNA_ORIENTATION=+